MQRISARFPKGASARRTRQLGESFSASVAVQLTLFGSGIILARVLGPSERGDVALVLALPQVAVQLAMFGLPSAATYFVARNPDEARSVVRLLAPIGLAQTIATALLIVVLSELFLGSKAPGTRDAGLLTAAAAPALVLQFYGTHLIQGLGELRAFNLLRFMNPALFALGLILGLLFGLTVMSCALVWLISLLISTTTVLTVLTVRTRKRGRKNPAVEGVPSRRRIVRFALAGYLAQVSPVETFRVDVLIVASLFPSRVVGFYAVALSVSNAPRFIADAIVTVAYPHISVQERAQGRTASRRYLLLAAALCGGVALGIAVSLPVLVPLLFGQRFAPAVGLGAVLVIAAGIISVRRVGTDCLRALGKPGVSTLVEMASLSVLAAGVALMGHWAEGRGVALSLLASATVGLLLTLLTLRRT